MSGGSIAKESKDEVSQFGICNLGVSCAHGG